MRSDRETRHNRQQAKWLLEVLGKSANSAMTTLSCWHHCSRAMPWLSLLEEQKEIALHCIH